MIHLIFVTALATGVLLASDKSVYDGFVGIEWPIFICYKCCVDDSRDGLMGDGHFFALAGARAFHEKKYSRYDIHKSRKSKSKKIDIFKKTGKVKVANLPFTKKQER